MQVCDFFSASCNPDFKDSDGDSCLDLINKQYCTSDGGYGDGWGCDPEKNGTFWTPDFGLIDCPTFEKYARNGQTARVCPECGCGRIEENEQGNLTIYGISLRFMAIYSLILSDLYCLYDLYSIRCVC